jgi:hypothetical protein
MTGFRIAGCFAFAVLVSGCAGQGSYPSLAARPIEGIMDKPVVEAVAPPATPNSERAARIAAALAQAEAADRDFRAGQAETERAVSAASGAARGDERWLAAQQQLSRLEAARVPVGRALADLDELGVAQADAASRGTPSAEADALASAYARVTALDSEEQAVLRRLGLALGN